MKAGSKRTILVLLGIALLFGILDGAWGLYGEFQNNNQGEYFDTVTGVIDFPYVMLTFAIAVAWSTLIVFFAEIVLYQIISLFLGFLRRKIE